MQFLKNFAHKRGENMGYLTARPTSNDLDSQEQRSPWSGDEILDDTALLLNSLGARCAKCKRVTRNQFLKNNLCPDCRKNPEEMPEVFKPEYMNLHELTGYVRAHLGDLLNGTASERGKEWGKAWITELVLRLCEIEKGLPTAGQNQSIRNVKLSLSFLGALRETIIATKFAKADEYRLCQLRESVRKVKKEFQKFLNSQDNDLENNRRLKDFCVQLCSKLPYKDRFGPGRLVMEIKLPPKARLCPRRNYMADGQAGEAD